MNQFPNLSSQYYQAMNSPKGSTNSENNQKSFSEQTAEFLCNLEKVLTKQNENFLVSMENILTNVIRRENQENNIVLKSMIIDAIREQNKNSNLSEQSERSHLTFTFGEKKEPMDSIKRKNKNNVYKNFKNDFFST